MRYGAVTAVDRLDLDVTAGQVTAVVGPNGAGKTTTLETCEGFRRPHDGSVRVLGLDPVADAARLRPRVGTMLQSGGAWSGVRAPEALRHAAALHAHPLDPDTLADRLGLGDCGRTPYRRLSGGQQQRLGLAMAIIGRPELVFLDEPTAGLDPQARRSVWELVSELRVAGVTVVVTTHYLDEAEQLADQVVVVDHGRVLATGTPAELDPGVALTAYRLVQEALGNSRQHAGVAAVRVVLDWRPGLLTLAVEDDGRGVVDDAPEGPADGKGLWSLRERVQAYGGRLRAGPRTGGGFAVCATLPTVRTTVRTTA